MSRYPTSLEEERDGGDAPLESAHGDLLPPLQDGSIGEEKSSRVRVMIDDMRDADKPRERLKRLGARALGQEELLAIILRVGMRNKSVLDLAAEVLSGCDNDLLQLADQSVATLQRCKGMGGNEGDFCAGCY